jgi:hypothetical protein
VAELTGVLQTVQKNLAVVIVIVWTIVEKQRVQSLEPALVDRVDDASKFERGDAKPAVSMLQVQVPRASRSLPPPVAPNGPSQLASQD